jgi:hypothetical protein
MSSDLLARRAARACGTCFKVPSPRLAVIVATPPGFNAGMLATELALTAFLHRHALTDDAQCYRLVPFAERLAYLPPGERRDVERRADTGIAYRSAFADGGPVASSDAVLFWADYLHMGIYQRELAAVIGRDPKDLLLLAGADDAVLRRTISFGTTLLFNTLGDETEPSYAVPLRRLLVGAKRVWVRDALSAAKVAHLRNDYETGYLGVDCAQLLTRADALGNAAARGLGTPAEPGSVLVFCARDRAARGPLLDVAAALGDALASRTRWLPWGDAGGFPALEAPPPPLAGAGAASVHELLNEVAHAALVVTDTYHLALTAWNFGVPAVCAFTGDSPDAHDVSSGAEFSRRDKREVFYSQYDALDFLIRPEELADRALLQRRTNHLAAAVADVSLRTAIAGRMHAHADAVETALARDLSALLQRDAPAAPAARSEPATNGVRKPRAAFRVAAVMAVANEEVHIESALRDLIGEGIEVVLIDHDSDDRTIALARPFLGHGLLSIEQLPWNGSFSIVEQLEAKQSVIDRLEHDWIVHVDADEWLSSPEPGQTLLDGLREADEAGYNAVHFNEFVFVPRPGEDLYAPDYRRHSRRYYFYQPHYPYLVRAWKHRSGLDNRGFGGHFLSGPVRQYPVDFPLRHYIALSEAHARRKYVGRTFAESELAQGFHYDRVGLTPEQLRFPDDDEGPLRTLEHWSSKRFDTSAPVKEHFWYWHREAAARS